MAGDRTSARRLLTASTSTNLPNPSAPRANLGLVFIVLTAVLWGTGGIAGKMLYTVADTNAISVGFFRILFTIPVLLLACWCVPGRATFRVATSDLLLMLLFGAAMASYQVCYFAAIAYLGVTIAVLIEISTAPVIVALLSALFLRERLTPAVLLALAYAILGIVFLVSEQSTGSITAPASPVGVVIALVAGFSYALITLVSRVLAGRYHAPQPITIGFSVAALLLPVVLTSGLVIHYPPDGWRLLLYVGVIPTTLAYLLFVYGLRSTPATIASITTLLEPLTSAVLAWLLFGERLGRYGLLGAALLLGAMLTLVQTRNRR